MAVNLSHDHLHSHFTYMVNTMMKFKMRSAKYGVSHLNLKKAMSPLMQYSHTSKSQ